MPTFICYLNWTDQGAKNTKDIVKRYQASKAVVEKLGGRMLSVYVTTGQWYSSDRFRLMPHRLLDELQSRIVG